MKWPESVVTPPAARTAANISARLTPLAMRYSVRDWSAPKAKTAYSGNKNVRARIQTDVSMLPERQDVGRALRTEEESCLLLECGRSRSRILFPFVVLALETGASRNTIRTLQWANVDLMNRSLKFGKDKTAAGTGRIIPLNQRAWETLKFWAEYFPQRLPEHYVFRQEKVGAAGNRFDAKVYATDPTKPVGTIKEAWETAKRQTRRHCPNCDNGILADKAKSPPGYVCVECKTEIATLPAGLVAVRFHDLRHTAVSRMIAAGVPPPLIAKIVGWSADTMAKMAARYGHFGIEELRSAVEAITRNREVIASGSSQKSQLLRTKPHPVALTD